MNEKPSFLERVSNFLELATAWLIGYDVSPKTAFSKTETTQDEKVSDSQTILFSEYKDKLLVAIYNKEDNTKELFPMLDKMEGKQFEEAFKVAMRNQSIGICAYYLNNDEEKCKKMFSKKEQFSNYLELAILYDSDKVLGYFLQDERFQNALNDATVISKVLKHCYRDSKENCLEALIKGNKNCYLVTEDIKNNNNDKKMLYDIEMINKVIIKGRYDDLEDLLPKKEETAKIPKRPKI